MNSDLKLIKKYYGEDMMHYVRDHFSTILESEGLLFSIFYKHINPTKDLYSDLLEEDMFLEFDKYIFSYLDDEKEKTVFTHKSPYELMDEAGYKLYKCKSENDIQKFKKYYADGEELCTFRGGRLETCYVFFAVKKNVDQIKRKNFKKPSREDEYGTSVISIQFTRGCTNILSIKNRYNHTVPNPDATFSNNLDNIIPGLTNSFIEEFNLNNVSGFDSHYIDIPNYVKDKTGRLYKYNVEIDNIYYCPNNIIIDNFEVVDIYANENSSQILLVDYFVIDLKNKKIIDYEKTFHNTYIGDDFFHIYDDIKKIDIKKDGTNKIVTIYQENGNVSYITMDKNNRMIEYVNNNIKNLHTFLKYSEYVKKIELNSLESVFKDFLYNNSCLKKIYLPKLDRVGFRFLSNNYIIEEASFPNLRSTGDRFLESAKELKIIKCPNLEYAGNNFLEHNTCIEELYLPKLISALSCFLSHNKILKKIYAPKLENVGELFLASNKNLRTINFPNLKHIADNFISENRIIKKAKLDSVTSIGKLFMYHNLRMKHLKLPKVEIIEKQFLQNNTILRLIYAPKLIEVGNYFLSENNNLKKIIFPELKKIGDYFLYNNTSIEYVELPKIEFISNCCLTYNNKIREINLPNVKCIKSYFLNKNMVFNKGYFPVLKSVNQGFLYSAKSIETLDIPKLKIIEMYFLPNCTYIDKLNTSLKLCIFNRNFNSFRKKLKISRNSVIKRSINNKLSKRLYIGGYNE